MVLHIIVNCEKYNNEKEANLFLKKGLKLFPRNENRLIIFKNNFMFQPILKTFYSQQIKVKNKSGGQRYIEIYKCIEEILKTENDLKIHYYQPEIDLFINKNPKINFINGYFIKINLKMKNMFLHR